jgi:hypothetical protein
MKSRIWTYFSAIAVALFSLLATSGRVSADDNNQFKWVISVSASALASDGSSITLTGSGTFSTDESDQVTGGGTWSVSTGGSGNFQVTQLVRFALAPGSTTNPSIHAGLAFLRVAYSDGSRGVLTVSCALPGSPSNIEDGAHASKGFVDYFNRQLVPAPVFFQQLTGTEK